MLTSAQPPILSHWIDGRPVEVHPEHTGPVHDPAHRVGDSPGAPWWGSPRSTLQSAGRPAGLPGLARHAADGPERDLLRLSGTRLSPS